MSDEKKKYPGLMICLGLMETTDNKLTYGWLPVPDSGDIGSEVEDTLKKFIEWGSRNIDINLWKIKGSYTVGAVYAADYASPERDRIYGATIRFKQMYPDSDIANQLQARSSAIGSRKMGEDRLKKLEKDGNKRMFAGLDEARAMYQEARGVHRAHLLAAFVEYICR